MENGQSRRARVGVPAAAGGADREPGGRGSQDGFTLVEVLVAMLILTIGVLGVQGLMIRAAGLVSGARDRTDVALAVGDAVERELDSIGDGEAGSDGETRCGIGGRADVTVCVTVAASVAVPESPVAMLRLTVSGVHQRMPDDTFTVVSHVVAVPIP